MPKHVLDVDSLGGLEVINQILDLAEKMYPYLYQNEEYPELVVMAGQIDPYKVMPILQLLFREDSTRTRKSYERAGFGLGMRVSEVTAAGSKISVGESLSQTANTLVRYGAKVMVVRDHCEGAAKWLARYFQEWQGPIKPAIHNAGDGSNEHPTQLLTDLFVICRQVLKSIEELDGKTVVFFGDCKNSRVFNSWMKFLSLIQKEGIDVKLRVVTHEETRPKPYRLRGIKMEYLGNDKRQVEGANFIVTLRTQEERMTATPMLIEELRQYFLLTPEMVGKAHFLHPKPVRAWNCIIRGKMLTHPQNLMDEQVSGGVAVRMALLWLSLSSLQELFCLPSCPEIRPKIFEKKASPLERIQELIKSAREFLPIVQGKGVIIDHLPRGYGEVVKATLVNRRDWDRELRVRVFDDSSSPRSGLKDIVVITRGMPSYETLAAISLICPIVTFNLIDYSRLGEEQWKATFDLPPVIHYSFLCPNPFCITNNDPAAQEATIFEILTDATNKPIVHCWYCGNEYSQKRFAAYQLMKLNQRRELDPSLTCFDPPGH